MKKFKLLPILLLLLFARDSNCRKNKKIDKFKIDTRNKNFETEETTTTSSSEVTTTTTEKPVCAIFDIRHSVNDENHLTIYWTVKNEDLCENVTVSIILEKQFCPTDCNLTSQRIPILDSEYLFIAPLVPCATYNYSFIIFDNGTVTFDKRDNEINANAQYTRVQELMASDKESPTILGQLLTTISWTYPYTECSNTSFSIEITYGENSTISTKTTNYSVTLDTLPACMTFNITVYPENNENLASFYPFDSKKVDPSEIRSFNETQSDTTSEITFSWEHPEHGAYCITSYTFKFSSEFHSNNIIIEFPGKSYRLIGVYDCVDYFVELMTNLQGTEETTTTEESTTYKTTEMPTIYETTRIEDTATLESEFSTRHTVLPNTQYVSKRITSNPRPFGQTSPPIKVNETDSSLTIKTAALEPPTNKCSRDFYSFTCTDFDTKNVTVESVEDTVTVEKLEPYHEYYCTARAKNNRTEWSSLSYNSSALRTAEGTPTKPKVYIEKQNITSTSFVVKWDIPTQPNGIIIAYRVYIKFLNFSYFNPSDCRPNITDFNGTVPSTGDRFFVFDNGLPYAKYKVQVMASNSARDSAYSEAQDVVTSNDQSDVVRNVSIEKNRIEIDEEYNKTICITWSYPCFANGNIREFELEFSSVEHSFANSAPYVNLQSEYDFCTNKLMPNFKYAIKISAKTDHGFGKSFVEESFELTPGIPIADIDESAMPRIKSTATVFAHIDVPSEIFNSTVGMITKIVVLLAQLECGQTVISEKGFLGYESKSITRSYSKVKDQPCISQYNTGVTLEKIEGSSNIDVTLGKDSCETESICNGYLRPGTKYAVTFRLYTATGFADVPYIELKTEKEVPIIFISILTLSILCVVFLIGFFITWRRTKVLRNLTVDSPYDRRDIAVPNFPAYYNEMITNDGEKIKEEYKAIQFFSENLDKTYIASKANEKLNRYQNIAPYDSTRVVLNEDEFENDYINASYVNGYFHSREYIAAQGPKQNTSFDFWRMVVQHKCESIVMLTSLVENNKLKCHEYFPRIHGHIEFCNIRIKCIEEEKYMHYIKRTLEVEKDDMKLKVKHYYYSSWPDHGCPDHPTDLIEFIRTVRNERDKPSNTFIVHCSAGVGRTGTFIALDIMMQRIKKEGKINIFDLVKQLRFQRMKMVQTIEQYRFLYASAIELSGRPKQPKVLRNIAIYFEELEVMKKLGLNLGSKKDQKILRTESEQRESTL